MRAYGRMADDRLDSWKAISAYLKRDVKTVQRWEKREGMPVHRHVHDKLGSVYAFRAELDQWMARRKLVPEPAIREFNPRRVLPRIVGATLAIAAVIIAVRYWPGTAVQRRSLDSLERAQFQMITDFEGAEQAAAVSRDGRFVAFVADRDGPLDVWITQIGTGQFHNLTRGRVKQLVNPSVRTLGFTPDGAFVTFWARGVEGAANDDIGIWAIPTLGGEPKPYLEGVAEYDWSRDGAHVVFHTPGPGDPMFVSDSVAHREPSPIFAAGAGLHAHFPLWSPDGTSIYFVQGTVPEPMDIWRMTPAGKSAEQITHHNAAVSHPVFVDDQTLMYLANVGDGNGPRLHAFDLRDRLSRVLGTSLDRYTSLAASADGRRLVATRTNPKTTLWRLPMAAGSPPAMSRVSLPTGRGFAPRLGAGYLLYVSDKGDGDAIWKLTGDATVELWSAPGARVAGGPELSPDGRRVAFTVEQRGKTLLYAMNPDGTEARVITDALQLRGAPGWAHDGQSIVSGATGNGGGAQLVRVSLDGVATPLIQELAIDPVVSPAGDVIVYTAADVGTQFPVKAATSDGRPHSLPALTLTRGARRLRFIDGGRSLLTLRGDIRHKDLWVVDLATGKEQQLTHLPNDFSIRDFDVSADGKEILLERVEDHSDIVLIELQR